MNNRKRMIKRVYRKNPLLMEDDSLLLPDFIISDVMKNSTESLIKVADALKSMCITADAAAKSFDWRKYVR